MAGSSPRSRFWRFVDQLTLTKIGLAAAGLTLLPAAVYWLLSTYSESSYLAQSGVPDRSILDALYFSFVTAATLGSEDITPHGWARLVVCLQVTGGLILAGIGIAKLTSMQGRHMRALIHNAKGVWIEPCCLPDGKVLVSLSDFREEDGEFCYDGENFDGNGCPMGFFSSQFIGSSQMILKFKYSNHDSCTDYFGDGITSHRFIPDLASGVWNRHHATCQDFVKGFSIQFEGYRATPEEVAIIRGSDLAARKKLIRSYVSRARRSVPATGG